MDRHKDKQVELLHAVAHELAQHNFLSEQGSQSFQKKTPFGKVACHLSFVDHESDFDVTVDVGIRFDDLENIINKQDNYLHESEKRETFSLGVELGNLTQGEPKRWTVCIFDDIHAVALSIANLFISEGLPYINRYSDKWFALNVLSGEDRNSWLHSPIDHVRAKHAVGLAFLMGEHDRMKKLIEGKKQILSERGDDFGLRDFTAFVDALGG